MILTHQQEIKFVGVQVSKESSKLISEKVTHFGLHGWESSFSGFTIYSQNPTKSTVTIRTFKTTNGLVGDSTV